MAARGGTTNVNYLVLQVSGVCSVGGGTSSRYLCGGNKMSLYIVIHICIDTSGMYIFFKINITKIKFNNYTKW